MAANSRITDLILMHLRGELGNAESQELEGWIKQSAENRSFFEAFTRDQALNEELYSFNEFDDSNDLAIRNAIARRQEHTKTPVALYRKSTYYFAIAATLCGLLAGGYLYLHFQKKNILLIHRPMAIVNDIPPGSFRAILKLGNGTSIILDSARNGLIASDGKADIRIQQKGQVAYSAAIEDRESEVTYNTLTTANASIYQVKLSDGTLVWLNNASSLKYPSSFSGKDRQVELTGEGYFEIAHNKNMPFKIHVGGMTVQDIGTSLNIMAYQNEAEIQTTLIDGEARVSKNDRSVLLQPGKQATLDKEDNLATRDVNTLSAIAWKKGFFTLDNSSLQKVLRQLARWYNIDIKYETEIPADLNFDGMISRNSNLSQVLKLLERNGMHYKLIGNTLTIKPS